MPILPDRQNQPPTAQSGDNARSGQGVDASGNTLTVDPDNQFDDGGWLGRAQRAYDVSTSYVDVNYRKSWEDSIRAFNNKHPADSKYNAPAYEKRSRLYRPKIRSVIRKNEAAAAAAFFSNMQTVSISASDQSDKAQLVSSDIMMQLVQYRLTKTIPWFQTVLGGLQDAQTTGVVCGHVHWRYDPEIKLDQPAVDLIPIENFRFDPSASWIDPVNTSPYNIHLMPMYAMDVQARMDSGEWRPAPLVQSANAMSLDSTRVARNSDNEDPQGPSSRAVKDYDIIWVHRHIHRRDGADWEFYTLGTTHMLTPARTLKDVVFHGKRPYIIGACLIEAHKVMPSSVPELGRGIAEESNEIANQRIDNVKFALNKKWFAKRGVEVDVAGLVRNVPGGVVMMNDPINDVREITWPDVTQSSYAEQQSLDLSADELLGNFNPAMLMTAGAGNAPARNMAMLNQSNGTLVEYLIRTYVETFVQPVLRQLVLLEQAYETDRVILGLAAKNSKMFQQFGMDAVTDELLNQEITLSVNVGMGATDPTQKLQKFLTALGTYSNILKNPSPGMNLVEVGKEIFSHLGYQDGSRFFTVDNPQISMLEQKLREAMTQMQQMQAQLKSKQESNMISLQKVREGNQAKIQVANIQERGQDRRALAGSLTTLETSKQKQKQGASV